MLLKFSLGQNLLIGFDQTGWLIAPSKACSLSWGQIFVLIFFFIRNCRQRSVTNALMLNDSLGYDLPGSRPWSNLWWLTRKFRLGSSRVLNWPILGQLLDGWPDLRGWPWFFFHFFRWSLWSGYLPDLSLILTNRSTPLTTGVWAWHVGGMPLIPSRRIKGGSQEGSVCSHFASDCTNTMEHAFSRYCLWALQNQLYHKKPRPHWLSFGGLLHMQVIEL